MYKFLLAIVVGLALEGCSVTRDGVRLGVGPSTSDIDNARSQLQRNAESSAAKKVVAGALNSQATAGLILVGAVGPLRKPNKAGRMRVRRDSESASLSLAAHRTTWMRSLRTYDGIPLSR